MIFCFWYIFLISQRSRIEATLFSFSCQLKMLDKTSLKVFCNIGAPLLLRCSLLPFKCCNCKVLECSINKTFLSKQSSVKHLFTSFAFAMKGLFPVMMFEMVTPCLSVFKLDATSTIDFAIRSGDRSESRSFVPTWRTSAMQAKAPPNLCLLLHFSRILFPAFLSTFPMFRSPV